MDSVEARKAMRKVERERADLMFRMKEGDLWLSGYDSLVAREQTKIRDMGLPQSLSISKWMQRKLELESEKAKYLREKANLEHDLSRLKLRKQELGDIEHTAFLVEQEIIRGILCPQCGASLRMETTHSVRCIKGHGFTLVRDE